MTEMCVKTGVFAHIQDGPCMYKGFHIKQDRTRAVTLVSSVCNR